MSSLQQESPHDECAARRRLASSGSIWEAAERTGETLRTGLTISGRVCRSLKHSCLGSHHKGPLHYDRFLTIDSQQLHPPYDVQEKERLDRLNYWDERFTRRLRWIMDPVVGLGCALAATLLGLITDKVWDFRVGVVESLLSSATPDHQVLAYSQALGAGVGIAVLCTLAAAIGVCWQPAAASSGIPGVIGFLNGCDMKALLDGRVLPVKLLGTALACGAGLCVGPEGPMIHIGTIVGMLAVNRCIRPALRRLNGGEYSRFEEELAREPLRYHIQAAAMGAGAGVAAAFRAPLAGTVFVVEEAASYFSKRMFFHTFITCSFSVVTTILIESALGSNSESMYTRTSICKTEVVWSGVLLLQATQVGVACGVLAAPFNKAIIRLNMLRADQARRLGAGKKLCLIRVVEVLAITVATSTFSVLLPAAATCKDASLQTIHADSSGCIPEDWFTQMVSGARPVEAEDVFGPPITGEHLARLAYSPAVGLFGVQYSPELCPKAVEIVPECNISHALAALALTRRNNFTQVASDTSYCCGFESLDALRESPPRYYTAENPVAPVALRARSWPSFACTANPGPQDTGNPGATIPQYSPSAALLLTTPRSVVRNLLTHGSPHVLPSWELGIYLFGYLVLAAATSGAWVPAGLVLPMMIIGGAVGRLSGIWWIAASKGWFPNRPAIPWIKELEPVLRVLHDREFDIPQDAGVLAMCGAAAFLSGSGSLMFFVVVLMLEITLDPFLIPVIILSMIVARCTASFLGSKGLYHELIEVQSLPFLAEHEHWRQRHWVAGDILKEDVRRARHFESAPARGRHDHESADDAEFGLRPQTRQSSHASGADGGLSFDESVATDASNASADPVSECILIHVRRYATVQEAWEALSRCLPGDSQPTVNGFPVVEDDGKLCGLVTRPSLEALLPRAAGGSGGLDARSQPLTGPRSSTQGGPAGVGRVMDRAPFAVQANVPVHHVHMLFRQLGLRHVVVVDANYRPLGVLTRKSLMPWRAPLRQSSPTGSRHGLETDSFVETRAQHSPVASPQMPRRWRTEEARARTMTT